MWLFIFFFISKKRDTLQDKEVQFILRYTESHFFLNLSQINK